MYRDACVLDMGAATAEHRVAFLATALGAARAGRVLARLPRLLRLRTQCLAAKLERCAPAARLRRPCLLPPSPLPSPPPARASQGSPVTAA